MRGLAALVVALLLAGDCGDPGRLQDTHEVS